MDERKYSSTPLTFEDRVVIERVKMPLSYDEGHLRDVEAMYRFERFKGNRNLRDAEVLGEAEISVSSCIFVSSLYRWHL